MSGTLEPLMGTGARAAERPVAEVEPVAAADRAILRTVTYASLFQSALTIAEIQERMMDVAIDRDEIRWRLRGPFLRRHLGVTGDHVHPCGRESWVELRHERRQRTEELLAAHRGLLRLMARFPYVRLVALSGACAHDNATDGDVDVFLIVRAARAWGVTLALTVLAKLAGKRRTLCVNYVVDEEALALPEQDVFTAAEIVGLRPLAGGAAYQRFVEANAWVFRRFPGFAATQALRARVPPAGGSAWLERLLDLGPAAVLERLSRAVLGARFRAKWARSHEGVRISPHRLKLHPVDHGPALRRAFTSALRAVGCADE